MPVDFTWALFISIKAEFSAESQPRLHLHSLDFYFFFLILTIFTLQFQWTRSCLGEQLGQLSCWFRAVVAMSELLMIPVKSRILICFVLISPFLPLPGAQLEKGKGLYKAWLGLGHLGTLRVRFWVQKNILYTQSPLIFMLPSPCLKFWGFIPSLLYFQCRKIWFSVRNLCNQ